MHVFEFLETIWKFFIPSTHRRLLIDSSNIEALSVCKSEEHRQSALKYIRYISYDWVWIQDYGFVVIFLHVHFRELKIFQLFSSVLCQ